MPKRSKLNDPDKQVALKPAKPRTYLKSDIGEIPAQRKQVRIHPRFLAIFPLHGHSARLLHSAQDSA